MAWDVTEGVRGDMGIQKGTPSPSLVQRKDPGGKCRKLSREGWQPLQV